MDEEDEVIFVDVEQKYKNTNRGEILSLDVVNDNDRITSDVLQPSELTNAIGKRAEMLSNGSPALIDASHIDNPIEIAEMELLAKKLPVKIRRIIGDNVEKWDVNTMLYDPSILSVYNKIKK